LIRLVVNADDLGLDPAIDRGILLAHRQGIVTSASLLPTGRSAAEAVRAARSDRLALGVHLCLTSCLRPAAEAGRVASLAPQGRFRRSWKELVRDWLGRKIHLDEVDLEFRAQLARARELGATPDHLDGHQHLHLLPEIAGVVASIAQEEGLPVRWPREDAHLDWAARAGPALKSAILNGLARAMAPPGQKIAAIGLFEAGFSRGSGPETTSWGAIPVWRFRGLRRIRVGATAGMRSSAPSAALGSRIRFESLTSSSAASPSWFKCEVSRYQCRCGLRSRAARSQAPSFAAAS